jgi:multiple sugar transport system permease protein
MMASDARISSTPYAGRKTEAERSRRRKRLNRLTYSLGIHLLLSLGALVLLMPLAWMLSTSLKDPSGVFVYPPQWIPNPVRFENYYTAMTVLPFGLFFRNTATITFGALLGQLSSCSLVAFSFARLRWSGRNVLFLVVLSTMMLPSQVTLIPTFLLFRSLGWMNTYLPMIIPAYFGGGPFLIFLMRQFFMTLSPELDDAARIDGCSSLGIYWRVILPLSKPVLTAAAIFSFNSHWDEFIRPLVYLQTRDKFTLALGLRAFQGSYGTEWHLLMAASLVVMLPVLTLFFVAQRYFIQGVVFTGVKG